MEIINTYGARAVFLLFRDHQKTESGSREIEIIVARSISNHKRF